MKMKKIIALLLALTICFSLCACGASETQKAVEAYQEFVSNNPYPIETDLQNQFTGLKRKCWHTLTNIAQHLMQAV